ncbi:MAG: NAD(P)-dependent oxidoreductase [Desulfobacterales bacterium]|jgi:hydroxypyruvate reductase 1
MGSKQWTIHNPSGSKRVIATKELPGPRWLEILVQAGCKVEVCTSTAVLKVDEIKAVMGNQCDGAIGQLTEDWGDELFSALKAAGGTAYSNYAVGFNNIDLDAATKHGIPVGNTPGVLTDTTAQMAVALTFAAARRTGEAERFLRAGKYRGWLPTLFLGELLWRKTVGVVGAGRIGAAYARMMVEGHKMNLIYYDIYQNNSLESYITAYSDFLTSQGEEPISFKRAETIDDVLKEADCVSIHTILDETTRHIINAERLAVMKENAILINTSRGPVIDESALVTHCRKHPTFRAGLDVFEDEPELKPGLAQLDNVVIVPHIASATSWTRQGMATLAASNVAGLLMGYPAWNKPDITSFLEGNSPKAAPSILNAKALNIPILDD